MTVLNGSNRKWKGKHGQTLRVQCMTRQSSQGSVVIDQICDAMSHHKVICHTTHCVHTTLESLQRHPVDVVLLDESSLLEESHAFLAHEAVQNSSLFAVVLSDVYSHSASEDWLDRGASDYLSFRQLTAPLLERLLLFGNHLRRQSDCYAKLEQMQNWVTSTARDGFWCWNVNTRKMYVSLRWQQFRNHMDGDNHLTFENWISSIHNEDQPKLKQTLREYVQSSKQPDTVRYRLPGDGAEPAWMLSVVTGIYNQLGQCEFVMGWERELDEKVMTHDPLTRLPNRKHFLEQLNLALARSRRNEDYSFAVIYIDLDQFKMVNDSLGHAAGDQLLMQVSERLRTSLRMLDTVIRVQGTPSQTELPTQMNIYDGQLTPSTKTPLSSTILPAMLQHNLGPGSPLTPSPMGQEQGTIESVLTPRPLTQDASTTMFPAFSNEQEETNNVVSRFGGDEFAVLLDDVKSAKDAAVIAQRIQNLLEKPFTVEGQQIYTSASIGVAHSHNGAKTAEDLLRDADIAMYKAKDRGKAGYALFDTQMHQEILAKLELETALRQALEQEEVLVYYQPIVSINDGHILGFEALLRWNHPELGWISPGRFVPIAEESGLIVQLGSWVLEKACMQLVEWHKTISPELCVNVNVSGKQMIQPHWVQNVEAMLLLTGVNPRRLRMEVTESSIIAKQQIQEDLQNIRDMGIKVQIDDFGTGYSSLSRLHQLPVDALKIDQSFIRDMATDSSHENIVTAIVKLGKTLNLDLVAEGIEAEGQWRHLHSMGVHMGQGYFFGRPTPPEEIPNLFKKTQAEIPSNLEPQTGQPTSLEQTNEHPPPNPLFTTASWY